MRQCREMSVSLFANNKVILALSVIYIIFKINALCRFLSKEWRIYI
jgi:hypothetical protein